MVIEMTSANTPWIFLLSNKIQQNMTSLQLFFASLPLQHDNISHKHEQFNNQLTSTTQITDPMATTNLVYHPTKPCILGAYLSWLCTPICFVPRCMLSWTDFRPTVTTYLLICQSAPTKITHGCHKHQQQFTIPMHLAIPCTHTINVAPQPTLDNVSSNQLDHPPDHHHIIHGTPTTIPYQTPLSYQQQPKLRMKHSGRQNHPLQIWALTQCNNTSPWDPALPVDCPHWLPSQPGPLST